MTPRQELLRVLDEEHADAILEHRAKGISPKAPLTSYAAKRLAKNFEEASDPNAAADYMIDKGWRGFEIEWSRGAVARVRPAVCEQPVTLPLRKPEKPEPTPQERERVAKKMEALSASLAAGMASETAAERMERSRKAKHMERVRQNLRHVARGV